MSLNGIDCATKLNPTTATNLKNASISAVGRYLGRNSWKGLTPQEVQAIHNAGLSVWLTWETDPTHASYFSYSKGVSDAQAAATEAEYLGAPHGTAIYFTVDFNAQAQDMAAIIEYFRGVRDGLQGSYLVGAYGSYAVLEPLEHSGHAPDRYWQTYAWSRGQVYPGHLYQYQNGVQIGGVQVDRNHINKAPGAWPEVMADATPVGQAVVHANGGLHLRDAPAVSGKLIANMPDSSKVEVLAKTSDNWWQVSWGGHTGYAAAEYLAIVQPPDPQPIVEAPVPAAHPEVKEVTQLDNLIVAYGDADMPAATELMNFLRCPVILLDYVTPALLAACKGKPYKVGGPDDPKYVTIAGQDRNATAVAVGDFIAKGKQ